MHSLETATQHHSVESNMSIESSDSAKRLPEDLLGDFSWHADMSSDSVVQLYVPDGYDEILQGNVAASEVLGVQRFITLVRSVKEVHVLWDSDIAARVSNQPHLFPLLAVALQSDSVLHFVKSDEAWQKRSLNDVRLKIQSHRISNSPGNIHSDLAVSVESNVSTLSSDLYNLNSLKLLPRESFETLAVNIIGSRIVPGRSVRNIYKNASLLGTILAELIENSDMHGRLHGDGRPVLGAGAAVRGVIFRKVILSFDVRSKAGGATTSKEIECFEVSVFDSGIGYFHSYTKNPIDSTTSIHDEWKVLHNCLERHYYPDLSENRPAHRGMGIFEVLRALQVLKGRIEFRTGSVYAYRTFFDDDVQTSMEPKQRFAHIRWPKPRLLDVKKKYVAVPTKQETLVGSSVRIIVPLD